MNLHVKQAPETPVRQAAESLMSLPVGTDRTGLRRSVNAISGKEGGSSYPVHMTWGPNAAERGCG